MIARHRDLKVPPWNTTIWRYMPLEAFLYLVLQRKLYFTNATGFTDKNEGVVPLRAQEYLREHWEDILRGVDGPPITLKEHLENLHSEMRDFWVSCWSMDPSESYALWKIYLRGSRAGVAIKSNVKMLSDALNLATRNDEPDVYLSRVSYSGFIKAEDLTSWKIISSKSPHYKYERELRLLLRPNWNRPELLYLAGQRGTGVTVDLDLLVSQIYLSPFMGRWFRDTIEVLLEEHAPNLRSRLAPSSVNDE